MYSYEVRIPRDRVAVLIGTHGRVKKNLERLCKAKLNVDSEEGLCVLKGEDTITLYQLRNVVKAIGRGFNPEVAQLLLKQDYVLELVNFTDYVKKPHMKRVRGRIIGRDGKARQIIEKLTDTFISVYGKTVCIIGTGERALIAKKAVEDLLEGAPHGPVFAGLEKEVTALRKKELLS